MQKEEIKKIIDKKEAVSFDVFDTLLLRNVYKPVDIFRILEKEVADEYGIEDFLTLRVKCEADSRTGENGNETSLDGIYRLIGKKLGRDMSRVKGREIELELEFIDKNPFMKEIYDYAIKSGKKVFLISDMYLPADVIGRLLRKAGLKSVPIYVSCEECAGKGTMKLYEAVLKKEGVKKDSWVHIGDNKRSDYEKAREFGIDAILYKNVRSKDKLEEPKTIEASIIRGIQNNYLYNGNEVSYWKKFGVLYASPIYYGFTNWLYYLTKDEDNLFFLARDGYVIKKVYDAFVVAGGGRAKTYYLYGSRKTFQLPVLLQKSKDELMSFLIPLADNYDTSMTIGDVLEGLELDYEKYKEKLKFFGFRSSKDVVNQKNYYQAKKFLKYIYDDIEPKLKECKKIALEYLRQEGLLGYDRINIMDVGWGGSLQEAIGTLTKKEMRGYYFGTIPTNKINILSNSLGYAFDEAKPEKLYTEIFNMPMMYEFIFSAPHGTTLEFKRKSGRVVPVLDEDDAAYIDIVDTLQGAAFDIMKVYLRYMKYLCDISVEDSISNYRGMIARRDFVDLKRFAELTNSVLYTNGKMNYIDEFDEDYIYDSHDEWLRKIHKAMWRDSYLVKGIETEEQWRTHRQRYNDFLTRDDDGDDDVVVPVIRKRDYIKKGIRNPKKAVRFVKNVIIKRD